MSPLKSYHVLESNDLEYVFITEITITEEQRGIVDRLQFHAGSSKCHFTFYYLEILSFEI